VSRGKQDLDRQLGVLGRLGIVGERIYVGGRRRWPAAEGTSSSARNQIQVVVCTSPKEWGSRHCLAGRWASHSCASSKTWPHPPVRRQQCARSTPTQLAPQQDIFGSGMANAQGSSTARLAVLSAAGRCGVAAQGRTPRAVKRSRGMS
jgi:hypothetical protein